MKYVMYPLQVQVTDQEVEQFHVGDVVRILDDIAKVHNLQDDHGGWVDDMALVGGGTR